MNFPLVETLVFSLFDILQYYLITNRMNNERLSLRWIHVPYIVFSALGAGVLAYSTQGPFSRLAGVIAFIALGWLLYRRKGMVLIYMCMIAVSLLIIIQLCAILPVYLIMGGLEYTTKSAVVAEVASLFIAYMVSRYLPLNLLLHYVEERNGMFRIISLNVFVVFSFFLFYWYFKFEGIKDNLLIITLVVLAAVLINLIFLKEGLKNREVEQQNLAFKMYMPIVSELIDDIRVKQHDFDNHIMALRGVIENQKNNRDALESVEVYLNGIEQTLGHVELLKMKNRIVAGFLYSKMKQALSENIIFEIYIDDYSLETVLPDYELLNILSILVDNAFETGVENNYVALRFHREKGRSVIEVANKHPYISVLRINEFFLKGFSSKNDSTRGLGLFKLMQTISSSGGEIDVFNSECEENHLVFKIILP